MPDAERSAEDMLFVDPTSLLAARAAIRRFRGAVTGTVRFSRTSGFIEDALAVCSIAAPRDMSRRPDRSCLAEPVATHGLGEDEAQAPDRRL
jgi:glucuronate isomerase